MKYIFSFIILFLSVTAYTQDSLKIESKMKTSTWSSSANFGMMWVAGDVDPVYDAVNSFHFSVMKKLNRTFSLSSMIGLSRMFGQDDQIWQGIGRGGGLIEPEYAAYSNSNHVPNYGISHFYLDLGGMASIGLDKVYFDIESGIGFSINSRSVNLTRFHNGIEMSYDVNEALFQSAENPDKFIRSYYDQSYETKFKTGSSLLPHLYAGIVLNFHLSKKFHLRIGFKQHFYNSDYIDTIKFRTSTEETNNKDHIRILTIGLSQAF